MPFYRWSLKAPRPKPRYPKQLKSLGDHLKARRLDIGLTQKEVAAKLAVDADSIRNWETGRSTPAVRQYPALLTFLEYDPFREPVSVGDAIRRERMTRGWSRKKLATIAGVDEGSVRMLESQVRSVSKRVGCAVCAVLELRNTEFPWLNRS